MKPQEFIWDKQYSQSRQKWKLTTKTLPNLLKGKSVLELGVGNGKTLNAILRQKPNKVTAIDISQEAINQCKTTFLDANLTFTKSNVSSLPFPDEEFDIVVCYYLLNNLLESERRKAIGEMRRVLKKGGKIIFEDFALGDFRQSESKKTIEEHTIQKKNGIICHFFSVVELKKLFHEFNNLKFIKKSSNPITNKPELKRQIISGVASK